MWDTKETFIDNDAQLYRQQHWPIIKNLLKRYEKGIYDSKKAVKLFMYLVDAGAKKFVKENRDGGDWHSLFPKSSRLQTAISLRDDFEMDNL